MKTIIIPGILLLLLLLSCSKEDRKYIIMLDDTLERKEVFDNEFERTADSLRHQYSTAATDSTRWQAAYHLEKIFLYHNVDSCHRYVKRMLSLQEQDSYRQNVSGACYANILYKMDSLNRARIVFERIDTTCLDPESFRIYSSAGYHIYRRLLQDDARYDDVCGVIMKDWWQRDSTNIECAYYHADRQKKEGVPAKVLKDLQACVLTSPYDSAKSYYFQGMEYLEAGVQDKAMERFALSATYDLRTSTKAYNALYELARILFRRGEIQRADRYMRMTLDDANSSNYALRYKDIVASEFEIMNVVLEQERKHKIYFAAGIVAVSFMLLIAIALLCLLGKYSTRLSISGKQLNEASKIKDGFLANYMEKCVDYLNKVDEYRSSLRHAAKHDGPDAILAMLRKPSFADGEFSELLDSLDSTFLSIFPDFVKKVNLHMQKEYQLELSPKGGLTNELRILAFIKMGITQRQKIAKILNVSVATIYTYHSLLQKHSLHPDNSFDEIIATL